LNFLEDFHEILYLSIFRKSVEKIQVSLKSDKNNGYFTRRTTYIFYHISPNSSQNEKCFRRKLYTKSKHTFCVQWLFFSENRAVYEIMWKNSVEPGRPQMTIWRTRIACWIPKATNTHSEYVTLIAFPLQKRSRERASLRYTYIACLKLRFLYEILLLQFVKP
jgi:hypothetical protein